MNGLDRITANPAIFGGKPIVRDMRISVELILSLLAQGESQESILDDTPDLSPRISGAVSLMPARPLRMTRSKM